MANELPPEATAYPQDRAQPRTGGRPPVGVGTVVVGAIAIAALYVGRDIFVPLALAILLSFVLSPIALTLRRWHVGRVPSVVVSVAIAFALIVGIGSVIGSQLAGLAENLPQYQSTIREKIQSVQGAAASAGIVSRATSMFEGFEKAIANGAESHKGGSANPSNAPLQNAQGQNAQGRQPIPVEISQPPATPLEIIRGIVEPLVQPLATTGIVIVFVIFILLQREDLRDRFIRLAGGRDLHRTTKALDEGVARLSRYFLMQSAINCGFGILIGAGLFVIGVPNPVLWGIMAALLRFVPYIGAPIAAVFPAALAIAVEPGWSMLFWTLGLFLVTETIVGQLAEPLIYGHSTGLSPVAVVIAAVFWTWLWGPIGLLLSTPLTICLVVLGRNVEHLQFLNVLLGDEPALSPEESFYQRLLAGDPDEAAHQAEQFLKEKPLSAYYDAVAIKGLALAQLDIARGSLDHERRIQIKEAVDGVIDNLGSHGDVPPGQETDGRGAVGNPRPVLRADDLLPDWRDSDTPVLCVAGRGLLDEAAAAMLAQLIQKHGIGASVVPSQAVLSANIFRLDCTGVTMLCLSYLGPTGLANARFLVRRLRHKVPRAKILLGLWTQTQTEIEGFKENEVAAVVTSLTAAVDYVVAEARGASDTGRGAPARVGSHQNDPLGGGDPAVAADSRVLP